MIIRHMERTDRWDRNKMPDLANYDIDNDKPTINIQVIQVMRNVFYKATQKKKPVCFRLPDLP